MTIVQQTGSIDLAAQNSAAQSATNYITADSSGIRIASANPATQEQRLYLTNNAAQFYDSMDKKRVQIDTAGLHTYNTDGNTETGLFGATTARIGTENGSAFYMNDNSLEGYNSNHDKYFSINANGITLGTDKTVATTNWMNSTTDRRNLLRKTKDFNIEDWAKSASAMLASCPSPGEIKINYRNAREYIKYKVNYLDFKDYNDCTVTLSFDAKYENDGTGGSTSDILAYIGFSTPTRINNYFTSASDCYCPAITKIITTSWARYSITRKIPTDCTSGKTADLTNGWQLTVEFGKPATCYTVYIKNIQLELGSTATEWSPAFTDLNIEIDDASKTATNYITDVTANDGIWITPSNTKPDHTLTEPGSVATGWHIGNVLEYFIQGVSHFKVWMNSTLNKIQMRLGMETSGHIILDEDGMEILDNETTTTIVDGNTSTTNEVISIAKFSKDGCRIGPPDWKNSGSRLELNSHSLQFFDKDNTDFFYVGNKEDSSTSGVVEQFDSADGPRYQLYYFASTITWVKINNYEISFIFTSDDYGSYVEISDTTNPGDKIFIKYVIDNKKCKTYTFGKRLNWLGLSPHSYVVGFNCMADGKFSYAEGLLTTANGNYSHVQNIGTVANYDSQTAIGKYNNNQSTNAFEIGNGSSESPRNAFTVDWFGNTKATGEVTATDSNDTLHNLTEKVNINGSNVNASSFCTALHVGDHVVKDQSTAIEMTNQTPTNICSITLPAGTWIIEATAQFATNATGRRYILLTTTSKGTAAADLRQTCTQTSAVNGGNTFLHTGAIKVYNSQVTLYLVGYQNSGGSLNTYGYISAVRIK